MVNVGTPLRDGEEKQREDQTKHFKEIKSVYSFTGSITIKASQNRGHYHEWKKQVS